jgi:UDP-N-acetylmuramate: L-alanyl-gamma-D-glutamyl-meso-diaminopimelate ligase
MRRKVFQDALPEALALADRVVLDAVHRAALLDDAHRLDPEAVAAAVRSHGKDACVLPSADAIADQLASEAKSGDIFLIMSNGSFDGLCDKLLNKFSSRQIPSEANAR